jgi:hypothetical protein
MQPPSWRIHVRRRSGVVQRKELISQPTSVLGLNAALRSRPKEPLDTFVPEALYHLYSVTLRYTEINSFLHFANTSKKAVNSCRRLEICRAARDRADLETRPYTCTG